MEIKHVFSFGKIAYTGKRKSYPVEVSVLITGSEAMPRLSISATVFNTRHTDCIIGGQCLDELCIYLGGNPKFKTLYNYWKQYHLNYMHAGTFEQEKALAEYCRKTFRDRISYVESCEYLKSIGLYEVFNKDTGKPYRYGSGWVYQPIPSNVIEELKKMIKEDN